MEKNKNINKPLKLSTSGRLQIRKNLGPSGRKPKDAGSKKTIQIVFRNKNNQQKSSSTTQSNFRGSSSFRTNTPGVSKSNLGNPFGSKSNKHFDSKNKKSSDSKKNSPKKSTLKPLDDDLGKIDVKKILEQEEQEFDKFPSLAKLKRAREKEKLKLQENDDDQKKVIKEIAIPEVITVQDLANRMAEKTADVVKTLMKMGVMANATQSLESDTAEIVAGELGHRVKIVNDDDVLKEIEDFKDPQNTLEQRAPIVTIMGHVDHGKTSILDAFRSSNVVGGESGGITQHIGAYQINNNKKITFIDTPGHAAFSNMRSRGSKTTDIIILVIAADDGLKPQTIESISHAKAANVPIIIAINKIDLPNSDPDKVRNELLNHEIIVEKLSGDVLDVEVSATKKINLNKLEEAIHLQADILNLSANPNRKARGVIIESKLEKGRGSVATVLVQKGTLKIGDIFVSGSEWGKVKALINDKAENILEALPSMPVEVLGFDSNPLAGDDFVVVENENTARKISEYRTNKKQILKNKVVKSNVEEMFQQISAGTATSLPIIIKADVQGSTEAIENSITKLSTEEVQVSVIHKGVGAITESDVALASSGKGFIVGFNVRAIPQARDIAKRDGVDIKYYSIIYELIDDIKQLLGGLLKPEINEKITGNVEIREIFSISKTGNIAGCFVKEGVISRNSKIRILRDNTVIHNGAIASLKRFKEEVKDVKTGYECGVMIENYSDIKVNDIIETFEIIETIRKL